jgi:hypothetical protein
MCVQFSRLISFHLAPAWIKRYIITLDFNLFAFSVAAVAVTGWWFDSYIITINFMLVRFRHDTKNPPRKRSPGRVAVG